MAENSSRRAIEFLVYGALPPHSTNVLWMDSSNPSTPVLKIWWNGAWVPVHTEKSKDIRELADAIDRLTKTNSSQQGTIVNLTNVTAKEATLTNGIDIIIAAIRDIDLSGVAKQGGNPAATLTDTQSYASSAATDAASAKNLIGTPASGQASDLFGAIRGITIDTTIVAKETQVKDGNDTAISVGKEIRSEVGTGSDTAAETGTLFAIVKWVKDKVKSIYNEVTDSTNGLSAIKQAIPTIPTDYAKAGSGTNVTNTDLKNLLNGISTAMYKGVPVVTPQGSGAQANPYVLQPNQWNQFSSALSGGDIYFSKGTDIANITNCYMVRFELAANWSGTSVNFEGFSLEWNGGSVPTWTAGKIYEVNIVDNIAMWAEITPAS